MEYYFVLRDENHGFILSDSTVDEIKNSAEKIRSLPDWMLTGIFNDWQRLLNAEKQRHDTVIPFVPYVPPNPYATNPMWRVPLPWEQPFTYSTGNTGQLKI